MDGKIRNMATVRKAWLMIHPVLVRRARAICGTEAETITQALRDILVRDAIDKAFRRYGPGLADIEDVFQPVNTTHA